ncbi:extracellular solute-binding protein [Pseudomonas sp. TCU-HL1]|uniref:extracellular solute-binding protein n=1 Tax=Pseudomonas sp. TCU-HL1 TaxID=1856685 RepID=UPI00083D9720|nr:extracellular solute-binding protein [Pseudomonas sp. TCU-HL1]AOE85891.1 ABC transporter substrate-binding protein [Pseudomonas sp. TCU-HL1]
MDKKNGFTLGRRQFLALSGTAAAVMAMGGARNVFAASDDEITILTWETYHDDAWVAEWTKNTGIKVKVVRAGSSDEIFAQTQSGAVKADIIYFETGSIPRYKELGLITPIDASKIPNAKNITSGLHYQERATIDGKLFGLPYNWGTQPLMYDETVFTSPPDSWAVLWDKKYQGKVSLFDDAYITFPMIALYVGAANPYNLTDAEFEECIQALRALRPQVRTIARGFDDALQQYAQGEAVVGYCQNINTVYALQSKGKKFNYRFPKEGTPTWIDSAVITPQGQREAVYRFMNDNLSLPWQGRFISTSFNNGVLTEAGGQEAGVPADILAKTNVIDQSKPGFWEKMSIFQSPENIDRRVEIWNDFKAGIL